MFAEWLNSDDAAAQSLINLRDLSLVPERSRPWVIRAESRRPARMSRRWFSRPATELPPHPEEAGHKRVYARLRRAMAAVSKDGRKHRVARHRSRVYPRSALLSAQVGNSRLA